MVIQRIQTLYLLIAAALMTWFSFAPFVANDVVAQTPLDNLPYFIYNIAIVLLLLINIFMYSNLRFQKMLTKVYCWMTVGSGVCMGLIVAFSKTDLKPTWTVALLCVALIAEIMAYRGMASDLKKLSSSDRIR